MTFTKGPWQHSGMRGNRKVYGHDVGPDNDAIAVVFYTDRTTELHCESIANARLIAAAPELFEVVEVIDQWHDHHAADAPEWRENDTVTVQLSIGELRAARAALSRARGEV